MWEDWGMALLLTEHRPECCPSPVALYPVTTVATVRVLYPPVPQHWRVGCSPRSTEGQMQTTRSCPPSPFAVLRLKHTALHIRGKVVGVNVGVLQHDAVLNELLHGFNDVLGVPAPAILQGDGLTSGAAGWVPDAAALR